MLDVRTFCKSSLKFLKKENSYFSILHTVLSDISDEPDEKKEERKEKEEKTNPSLLRPDVTDFVEAN